MRIISIKKDKTIYVDLSASERSTLGYLIGKMYYSTEIDYLLKDMISGYPHNGGMHTLRLEGNYLDVISAIEIIRDYSLTPLHKNSDEAKEQLTEFCERIKIAVNN